ncbi:MAG: translation initiation factor IF-2 [Ruminococcaceae bacterium]|nr:translation initiation factor IF-2 [Oscillospiraceae bacterium]
MSKYKVSDIAKDFGMSSKDIAGLLAPLGGEPKKSSNALEENELDFLFNKITKDNSVENFNAYFAAGNEAREKAKNAAKAELDKLEQIKKEAAEERKKRAAAAAKEKAAEEKVTEEKTEEKKPAEKPAKKAETKKSEPKKDEVKKPVPEKLDKKVEVKSEKPAEKPAKKVENKTSESKKEEAKKPVENKKTEAKKPETKKQETKKQEPKKEKGEPIVIPPQPKKEKVGGPAPNRGPQEVRRVDTRANNVDIEKYNEKYENIAPANTMKDNMQRKQKIKQKSRDQKRPQNAKRETEADRIRRMQLEKIKKTPITVTVGDEITVGELAAGLKKTAAEVIKVLMKLGVMASVSQTIDYDTAEIVVLELGCKIKKAVVVTIEERIMDDTEDTAESLKERDPIVVVMGHVDHGKTSLLDAIRNAKVTSTEAGGITQHIGAYRVNHEGHNITFLDTPGHAAFTSMRQRGAMSTDIAVLVVAADDGIMPQTVEAINHAKAAGVQIIVAINKMDKPTANPDRVKQQLTEHSLVPEEWGGDVICVPVSAHTHEGIDVLLENILLVAEMAELKANPDRRAKGVVIEARLDKGRGPVATLLVQNGTLNAGDIIVAGTSVGRVRIMLNEKGQTLKTAGPSVPVEITGLAEVPSAGDDFDAVSDERLARQLVEQRKQKAKEAQFNAASKVTLDNLFSHLEDGDMKELNVIVKADVQGSVEAVRESLEKISNEEVRVKVIHGGVGAINESDVMLAGTSGAIIVGFNVRPDAVAKTTAERDGVDIRTYRVIYDCIEEITAAMKGMLAPKFREVALGQIEVRNTYKISSIGTVAGCYVTDGKVTRNAEIRVVRDGIVLAEDKIASLRRFKDDVKEVAQGYECGITLEKYSDVKEGDIFEAFIIEEYRD